MRLPRSLYPHGVLAPALALLLGLAMPAAPVLALATTPPVVEGPSLNAVALPDLRVASVQVAPTTAAPGQGVALTFIVYNLGTATAPPASVSAMLSTNSTITTSDRNLGVIATTPMLPPRYGVRITRTVTLPADATGSLYLGAYADPANAVAESYENNNGAGAALTVGGGTAATPTPTPTTAPSPPPSPTPTATAAPAPSGDLAVLEQQVLARINEVRAQYGLGQLAANSLITNAARRHSDDMAANNFLSHTGSDGSTMGQRLTQAGYSWSAAGEIIAAGYTDPTAVVNAWMNSPGHRAIILTAGYREFGAGVARSASGRLSWTVDFATPR